jgi:CRISPR-associated protein Csm2
MITKEDIRKIFLEDDSGELLVETARKLANELKDEEATKTQIRNIFTEFRIIENRWNTQSENDHSAIRRLNMIKPKIAYQVKREEKTFRGRIEKSPLKPLENAIVPAIEFINSTNNKYQAFKTLMEFMEATLAYHKVIGGSDK